MPRVRVRLPAATLAALLVAGVAAPVAAEEPVAPATPEATVETPVEPMTIHAQMLAEHANDALSFTPGEAPSVPLAGAPSSPAAGAAALGDGAVTLAEGATMALPNGLRREVFGYLPYWSLSSAGALDYGLLSTIAYFGVAARSDGTLARTTNGTPTPGWAGWTSSTMTSVTNQAHALGVRVVLTVTMMSWSGDYSEMTAFLNSPSARARLIGEIAGAVRDRGADGVNLDWEPVPTSLRSQYTAFVREVKQGLAAAGAGSYVTVATMAGAASWSTGYDLAGLTAAGAADAVMVMAYDFSWSGSARAGGVAPVDSPYIFDAREALTDHLGVIAASKIIWGIPYYGRGWTTVDGGQNALACRSADLCPAAAPAAIGMSWAPTYLTALEGAAAHGPRLWDGTGQVPWYRYYDSGIHVWKQVYYDDAASLGAKYTLVEGNGLRGIGIWTLLMDAGRPELYDQIDAFFQGVWFYDVLYSMFRDDIIWLADAGIAAGCGNELFCPTDPVTRGQMAAFLNRALRLPATGADYFGDDETSIFEIDINRLAAAGIAAGCGSGRFCPNALVTRGEMAAFLTRALHLPPAGGDYFNDDETSIFEDPINRLAAAGITGGCGGGRFCPNAAVTRGEMAAFLRRALT
jgi:spore germination protein YaaH